MERREGELRSKLMLELKRYEERFVFLRHEDVRSGGHPDLSSTGLHSTWWWEFKHGTPDFDSPELQHKTMRALELAGNARYVLWLEDEAGMNQWTYVCKPRYMPDQRDAHRTAICYEWDCAGYDMKKLARYIVEAHREQPRLH